MNITVKIDEVSLSTVVGEVFTYDDEDDGDDIFGREPVGIKRDRTVAHLVAEMIVARLIRDARYSTLADRVASIRSEVIRDAIRPAIEEAVAAPIRKTNTYGDPVGTETTTLREIIVDEARKILKAPVDSYNRDKGTYVQSLVRDAVKAAFAQEIAAEVARARASVADEIGQQLAGMVTNAMKGR